MCVFDLIEQLITIVKMVDGEVKVSDKLFLKMQETLNKLIYNLYEYNKALGKESGQK